MAKVTMTLEEIMNVSEEELRAEETAVKRIPCDFDPDCPPLTEEMIKSRKFHRTNEKIS